MFGRKKKGRSNLGLLSVYLEYRERGLCLLTEREYHLVHNPQLLDKYDRETLVDVVKLLNQLGENRRIVVGREDEGRWYCGINSSLASVSATSESMHGAILRAMIEEETFYDRAIKDLYLGRSDA
mgnify:CR=1 FL=1